MLSALCKDSDPICDRIANSLLSSKVNDEERRAEQRKYGVFFDDDYDYLQHLKEPAGPAELIPSSTSFRLYNSNEREETPECSVCKDSILQYCTWQPKKKWLRCH